MNFEQLVADLSQGEAYDNPSDSVTVIHTHISTIFLTGRYAYKLKKPVNLGFLDFTTLEQRYFFCREEVRLNRRLAPHVYLGVLPVTLDGAKAKVDGDGEIIDYVVHMRRLPHDRTVEALLERKEFGKTETAMLATRIADFHEHADRSDKISQFGKWEVVARNCKENFEQIRPLIGTTISKDVFDKINAKATECLNEFRPLIEGRAKSNVPCDTHGDLHLDHVYFFPDAKPPEDLVIVDCIEFNERFRFADPISDIAFMAMDFEFHHRPNLAKILAKEYFEASKDIDGEKLLPFYAAYRAVIRGKVEGFELEKPEIPEEERRRALERARAHFLLALGIHSSPTERPCLVMTGGLPGTGKSKLAQGLASDGNFERISSDITRKHLAGLQAETSAAADFGEGIYTAEWNDRTYDACIEQAEELLFQGRRVIVDASFRADARRLQFLKLARSLCVPCVYLQCEANEAEIRRRLNTRTDDPSDADWAIYQSAAKSWEPSGPAIDRIMHRVDTSGTPENTRRVALGHLRHEGLA